MSPMSKPLNCPLHVFLSQKSISIRLLGFFLLLTFLLAAFSSLAGESSKNPASAQNAWEGPSALALSKDGGELFLACARSGKVLVLDAAGLQVKRSLAVPGEPSGLALSLDGRTLYVTLSEASSQLLLVNVPENKVFQSIPVGHTALSPVVSPDGATVYICNRFNNEVAVVNLAEGKMTSRIPVAREPVSAALTPDGKYLLVANHLHDGRADAEMVAAKVSVIDTAHNQVIREFQLPNGSGLLREVRISPDGRHAGVAHVLARYQLPTTQLERGWMNCNALTLFDLEKMAMLNTVLLDNVDSGGANPWAAGWTPDGKTLFITHAGTHELSLINFPGLLQKLAKLPDKLDNQVTPDYYAVSKVKADVPSDLAFLVGLRERISLKGKGPRAAIAAGGRILVAHYFSDTLEVVEAGQTPPGRPSEYRLGPDQPMTVLRRGELLFNDASICFQGWQSCASCHSSDARVDALNWDLINDGLGNPKNSKSLLLSHQTPPAMSMGVRDTAETAVRAGIRYIQFSVQPEEVPEAMDEWLKSLKPIPSPYLVNGQLSEAARRGEQIFRSPETHCATCHPAGLFTDLKHHAVGTNSQYDKPDHQFDTPTLIEAWRTAPYLHDGSALTLREVLKEKNGSDKHGKTSHLTSQELDDLVAYLLSL